MSENALVVPMATSKFVSTEVEKEFETKTFNFWPRIQVAGSNSGIVKEGKIGLGRIAIVAGEEIIDAGTQMNAFLLAWRPKAMRYKGNAVELIAYDPKGPVFDDIRSGALAGGQNNPNQFGTEFFLWLPDYNKVAAFFHGTTTLRNEAPLGITIFKRQAAEQKWIPVKFTIELAKKKATTYSWHTTRIAELNQDVAAEKSPNMENIGKDVNTFNNPSEDKKEKAENEAGGTRD